MTERGTSIPPFKINVPHDALGGAAVFAEDILIFRYAEYATTSCTGRISICGGHFTAMEVPDLLAEDVRTLFRWLW